MPIVTLDEQTRIYYERIAGESGRPCLVFLHEGLGCTAMWKDFPARLCRATGCPGLIYDRSGYGRSSASSGPRTIDYLHDYALGELPRVVNALIPGEPFVLIGHSDGGTIALLYGARRPPGLTAIITEAAHVFVEEVTLAGIRATVRAYDAGKLQGLARYHGDRADAVFRAWSDTWLSDWFRPWNIEAALADIACPVLVMQGRQDQYATEAQVTAVVDQAGGYAAPAWVDQCGHIPHLEQPEAAVAQMAAFIASTWASAPSTDRAR